MIRGEFSSLSFACAASPSGYASVAQIEPREMTSRGSNWLDLVVAICLVVGDDLIRISAYGQQRGFSNGKSSKAQATTAAETAKEVAEMATRSPPAEADFLAGKLDSPPMAVVLRANRNE